jgi:hypothetical protein
MNAVIFLSGVSFTAFSASALFFYKFWRASHDRFFLCFAIACELIALERFASLFLPATLESLWTPEAEATYWLYLIRLVAFVLILFAIIDKNRRTRIS